MMNISFFEISGRRVEVDTDNKTITIDGQEVLNPGRTFKDETELAKWVRNPEYARVDPQT